MDSQDQGGALADRRGIIGGPCLVGRAHLAQERSGLEHHVRDTKAPTDLDQLPAGNNHFAPGGERGQHDQDRCRVVVDHHGRLGAGQATEECFSMDIACTSATFVQVVLEVRVPRGDLCDPTSRRGRQRRASEVGVHDDPRRIDHGAQRTLERLAKPVLEPPLDMARRLFGIYNRRACLWSGLPTGELLT